MKAEAQALTPFALRALEFIEERGETTAGDFADAMWPDSDGHKRQAKAGNRGTRTGHGMVLAAGSQLGKLRKKKFVTRCLGARGGTTYKLSDGGVRALHELRKRQKYDHWRVWDLDKRKFVGPRCETRKEADGWITGLTRGRRDNRANWTRIRLVPVGVLEDGSSPMVEIHQREFDRTFAADE